MPSKIRVQDAPTDRVIFSYLAEKTGYAEAIRSVTARTRLDAQQKLELSLPGTDIEKLRTSVIDALRQHGTAGWQYTGGYSLAYGGLSLTCNPDHADGVDPRFSSMGSPRNRAADFTYVPKGDYAGGYGALKNSYYDTYGFRVRTPASKDSALAELIESVPLSLVRSRIGIIPGGNVELIDPAQRSDANWHQDEPVFENLRINIPLQTDPNFVFESEGVEPYHLEVGGAYTWDTHRPHRVYCRSRTRTIRIHAVLGFAPWYRYDPIDDSWEPNAYFGKIHPFDMIAEGLFGPRIAIAVNPRERASAL